MIYFHVILASTCSVTCALGLFLTISLNTAMKFAC